MPKFKIKNVKNETANNVEIDIFDDIDSSGWWGMSAKDLKAKLDEAGKVDQITLNINSPGGEVVEGFAIYNLLKRNSAKIIVNIDGMCASIASVIAMSADEINIADNAFFMIHNPWTYAMGESEDLRKTADIMDKMADGIISAYQNHVDLSAEEIKELMNAETWYQGQEAVDAGFAHNVYNAPAIAASVNVANFANVPEKYKNQIKKITNKKQKPQNGVNGDATMTEAEQKEMDDLKAKVEGLEEEKKTLETEKEESETEKKETEAKAQARKDELVKITDKFGAEIASKAQTGDLDFSACSALHIEALTATIAKQDEAIKAKGGSEGASPAKTDGEKAVGNSELSGLSSARAKNANAMKFV